MLLKDVPPNTLFVINNGIGTAGKTFRHFGLTFDRFAYDGESVNVYQMTEYSNGVARRNYDLSQHAGNVYDCTIIEEPPMNEFSDLPATYWISMDYNVKLLRSVLVAVGPAIGNGMFRSAPL